MYQQAIIWFFETIHGNQDPIFRERVYIPLGAAILLITLLTAITFYYGLNLRRARFNRLWPHWGATLAVNAVCCFLATWIIAVSQGVLSSAPLAATILLSLIAAFYAAIGFYLASFVMKPLSPNASNTPH
jgi:FtsH-binding integral membrane protein